MKQIAILDNNFYLLVFLNIENGIAHAEFFNTNIQEKLSSIVNTLNGKILYVEREEDREGGGNYLIAQPVAPTDPEYPEAVLEELKSQGFKSVFVEDSIKSYLILVNKFPLDAIDRRKLVVMLINSGDKTRQKLIDLLEEIKPTLDQIKENREEWKKFLQEKTTEFLNSVNS